jgi:hypothetical protein
MAIITISRGSYSKGREVAEKAAARLGYQITSRDVLLEASDRFHIPELKLVSAIHDAPSLLNRFTHGKECYIAYIRSALADRAKADNLVYHGLAGHLLLKGVPHVLKVRIIADLDARVEAEMKREGISATEARRRLLADDEERRKWTHYLYGVDPWDVSLYDLVIHIHKLGVDDAVEFIVQAAGRPCFSSTPEAQQKMDDLALACRIKAALVKAECFGVGVISEYGNVIVFTGKGDRNHHHLDRQLDAIRRGMPDIHHLEVHSDMSLPESAV